MVSCRLRPAPARRGEAGARPLSRRYAYIMSVANHRPSRRDKSAEGARPAPVPLPSFASNTVQCEFCR